MSLLNKKMREIEHVSSLLKTIKLEMPPEVSEVMKLYYIEGMAKKDIAIHLNRSVTTIRSRIGKGNYLIKKHTNDKELMRADELIYGKR